MANSAPPIDQRTASEIVQQVQYLLTNPPPNGYLAQPLSDPTKGTAAALIGVFGRFSELVIQRLNQAPGKNFLAYLDLLGASRLPPQSARAPLTFSLAAGSVVDAVVPAGTQVAAPPAPGESAPVIFETEEELVVTAAQLDALWVRDPTEDRYADSSAYGKLTLIAEGGLPPVPFFRGIGAIQHILYIGQDQLLRLPAVSVPAGDSSQLKLTITLAQNIQNPIARTLAWEIWDGAQGIPLVPASDGTSGLTQSGDLVFANPPPYPETTLEAVKSRWLRGRLLTPITPAALAQPGQLPVIQQIQLGVDVSRNHVPVEAAFADFTAVDLSKDFFPFGEKPKFNDTLYLAQAEAFSQAGAAISLKVSLSDTLAVPPPRPDGKPQLQWEYWDGDSWNIVGQPADGTQNFLKSDQVTFTLPGDKDHLPPAPLTLNGVTSFWVRVRLVSGNYGVDATYVKADTASGYQLNPATFQPPSLRSIEVTYHVSAQAAPDTLVTYNNFSYKSVVTPFAPYTAVADPGPSLYLGLYLPPTRTTFPNVPLSFYFWPAPVAFGTAPDNPNATAPATLVWEYWNGRAWLALQVQDGTSGFTQPGAVELLPPGDIAPRVEFELSPRYWLRVRWDSGDYVFEPRLQWALLNTTMAAQTVTFADETAGSSNGSANQIFQATHVPVLPGVKLEIGESEMPSAAEREEIVRYEGEDAITLVPGVGGVNQVWVRWHQVPDFYASGPRDRHYVLDYLTGVIRFGDGLNGRIPPAGTNNIRLARYQTGGGSVGNRPAFAIVQLKTTVPYVDKVTNPAPAVGGAEAEDLDSLIARAPRTIRHRGRAVAPEDYEDLTILASPRIARAKCVPLRDLSTDPAAQHVQAGTVSVIIVPHSTAPAPLPGLDLIERVQAFLDANRVPTAKLVVVGPLYVPVNVTAEVALSSLQGASEVEQALVAALEAFLHPLTGGLDGAGWDFGRQPHRSDVYALLESIAGVDHIKTLVVETPPAQSQYFLVSAGTLTLSLLFEGQ